MSFVIVTAACVVAVTVTQSTSAHQPKIRTLTEQEMVDMMVGTSIQSSRANNSANLIKRVKAAIAEGKKFTMVNLSDVPDDWMVVAPGALGGGGAWEYVIERTAKQNLQVVPNTNVRSIQALSKHIGKQFDALIRVEAAGATLTAFLAAADMGIPVVDACLSGRARPETQQQIPWINGIPSTPAALFTRWGDTVIIDRAVDDYRSEDIGRGVAVASGGGAAMAINPMTGRDTKRGTIPGAVSDAILIGRTVREAGEKKLDPVEALVGVVKGFRLFHGTVAKADGKGERGFTWFDVDLNGLGPFAGHTYKIYVKNENIVTWLDGVPDAMSPDFIQNVHPKTGDAMVAKQLGGYEVGEEVVIVGWPSSPLWRTPKGIEIFGPRHFGFDFDYVPIEELQKRRKTADKP